MVSVRSTSSCVTRPVVEHQPMELLAIQGAGEQVAVPLRHGATGVEGESRRRHRLGPHMYRRLDPRRGFADADLLVGVVLGTEGHLGPAVVGPRLDAMQQVATVRTVLRGPDLTGLRMNRDALVVAMAEGVDLRTQVAWCAFR
jgi:hypothetical protein